MKKQSFLFSFTVTMLLFLSGYLSGQLNKTTGSFHQIIQSDTDRIFDRMIQIRRHFHEYPELAGHEKNTQEEIIKHLISLGLQVHTDLYGYGVVGVLKGAHKGRSIAWRADMDALSASYPDKADFKSKNTGIQHGCGHDVHMAIALGIAEILAKNKKSLSGTVYFIFQPEEEIFKGAERLIEHQLLSKFNIEQIYALHVTALPVGEITVKNDEMFAYQRAINIRLRNTLSEDQINVLSKKIPGSLIRTPNNSKPWELQSISDKNIGLSNPETAFKDYLISDQKWRTSVQNDILNLHGEIYETDRIKLKNIFPAIRQVIKDENHLSELISISYSKENPTIQNNHELTRKSRNIFDKIYGKKFLKTSYGQIPYFNDDFAYFQQKIPGVYFFLGGSNSEKQISAMNHAPDFEIDEECVRIGIKAFSSLIFEQLK